MRVVVVGAARSSPGVTTAVLALASVWPGRVLVVEASEDGGVLAARFGLRFEPGVASLAAAVRHDPDPGALWAHTQPLATTGGRVAVLVGPPTPEAAQRLWRTAAGRLAAALTAVGPADPGGGRAGVESHARGLLPTADGPTEGGDPTSVAQSTADSPAPGSAGGAARGGHDGLVVLVDAGRLPPAAAVGPLVAVADRFVLVARPRVEELQVLAQRLGPLGGLGARPQVLLVGRHPYGPGEVAATLGCQVVGVLADDRPAADALAWVSPARRIDRSELLRSAVGVADRLLRPAPARSADPAKTGAWTAATTGLRG